MEGDGFQKPVQCCRLVGDEVTHRRDGDQSRDIQRPGIERDDRGNRGRRRVDDIGEFLMRDFLAVGDRPHGSARQDRADRAALVEDDAH